MTYCIYCIKCEFDRWVPYHPEFKCTDGGEMDVWTTQTIWCPREATPSPHPTDPVAQEAS